MSRQLRGDWIKTMLQEYRTRIMHLGVLKPFADLAVRYFIHGRLGHSTCMDNPSPHLATSPLISSPAPQ
jgi:hypothetical protein